MAPQGEAIPQLPVSCLAAFVAKGGRSPEAILRPYKLRETVEGRARIICHPPAVTVIRRFYKSGMDFGVVDSAIAEWRKRADGTNNRSVRARLLSNIDYISRSRVHLAGRDFQVLPNQRITCQIGQIVFTASPDLWVRENGVERLIKIGFGRKDRSYIDALLIVVRTAAVNHGRSIGARNVVYLHSPTGQEFASRFSYEEMVLTLTAAAREIVETWPKVKERAGKFSPRRRAASAGT
jgi:hypothetical protein